jgi:energy-coupling factor transporter transmembrane protein EcfT
MNLSRKSALREPNRMKWSRRTALLILTLTLAPLVYLAYFVLCIVVTVITQAPNESLWLDSRVLMGLHLATIFLSWMLIAVYLCFLFKTEKVPKDEKAVWAVVLIFMNVLVMPVFWYLYIWSREPTGGDVPK